MPIVRTFMCPDCAHRLEVTLTMAQVDDPPPDCPRCAERTRQEFKPVAIGGSTRSRAAAIAEDIVANDYGVADFNTGSYQGEVAKVRYKEAPQAAVPGAGWGAEMGMMQTALANGRQTRLESGNPLDALKHQPDLIAASKARSVKIW